MTINSPLSFALVIGVNYLTAFANRVRRLRETSGLSIQEACERGELSANFWGNVERGEQEPCLLSIQGIAKGLGLSIQALMTLDDIPFDNNARTQINELLDLCSPDQVHLSLQIVKAIYAHRPPSTAPPNNDANNKL